ncbi:metal-dependent hydrolase [Flavisolibacter sp. BT320]|nr:metal-dependent hydrolase [Flavisolibacter longurius]
MEPEHFRPSDVFGCRRFFALLANIDHTRSIASKMFYPVAKYQDRKFGHRTITHTLLFFFVLSLVEKVWSLDHIYTMIFLWAYGSHLIFDMLTLQERPCFIPSKRIRVSWPATRTSGSVPAASRRRALFS